MSNGTSTTHLSPATNSPLPNWARPRSPLPPHKLAKLANALGVSTPLPYHSYSPSLPTFSGSPSERGRSPTPSSSSTHHTHPFSPSASKFLLHVIPPLHLPHELEESDDVDFTLPPSSGYHKHFRRGTLVPLHSTLQSQLGAIAKEYALPSTTGMLLYLVSSSPTRSHQASPAQPTATSFDEEGKVDPGPRLSEEIWKHLWTRVIKSERDDFLVVPARSPTPNHFGLGISNGPYPAPFLLQEHQGSQRHLVSGRTIESPQTFTPSPSTASSVSVSKSTTQSEPETPDTSSASQYDDNDVHPEVEAMDLPGLHSPSIIPILAKVEFDIDRRKAGWYEPWVRSRRMNHAKRAESRMSNRKWSQSQAGDSESGREEGGDKKALLALALVDGAKAGYVLLTDSEASEAETSDLETTDLEEEGKELHEEEEQEKEQEESADKTARMTIVPLVPINKDPLEEVFGSDADTWVELHAEAPTARQSVDPNAANLALTADELSTLPDSKDLEDESANDDHDKDEILELMDKLAKPMLSVSIPPSPTADSKRRSSPITAGTIKKHIPPPLTLPPLPPNKDLAVPSDSSPKPPESAGSGAHLLYATEEDVPATSDDVSHNATLSPETEEREERARSPNEDKRVGGVYDDLDLGLGEYDEDDPYDRRKSQWIMKAKLDEIERNLAQFSPQRLKTDLSNEDLSSSATIPGTKPTDTTTFPPTPSPPIQGSSWPSVPFSSLNHKEEPVPSAHRSPPPPQLAVNGITTGAPKAFRHNPRSSSSNILSEETQLRRREHAERGGNFSISIPLSISHKEESESPVIPLSPDPFGRYSSSPTPPPPVIAPNRLSSPYWESPPKHAYDLPPESSHQQRPSAQQARISEVPSSRFSADSVTDENPIVKKGNSLMSVKSIKKLWRKSNKSSISEPSGVANLGRNSPQTVPPIPHDGLNVPTTSRAPSPSSSMPPPPPISGKHKRVESALDSIHFDQESPYPVRRSTSSKPTPPLMSRPSISGPTPERLPTPPLTAPPEKEKTGARKSILKSWKSASGALSHGSNPSADYSRTSSERPSSDISRSRRPSVLDANKYTRGSVISPDIPPSPRIPEAFMNPHPQALRPRPAKSSSGDSAGSMSNTKSPPRSMMSMSSSRDSGETRPSFDTSQFEMVSPPRTTSTLSYPYHALDHE